MFSKVPETKGLSLEEMDEIFGSQGLAAADQERQEAINYRIGLSKYDRDPVDIHEHDVSEKLDITKV